MLYTLAFLFFGKKIISSYVFVKTTNEMDGFTFASLVAVVLFQYSSKNHVLSG